MVTAVHPDLEAEQAYMDAAYERLAEMRKGATERLQSALSSTKGGTFQARAERDIVVVNTLRRLEQLDIGDQPLSFGRIDGAPDNGDSGVYYIGRLAVSGADQEPLVVDWRAPVAEPFYRATGRHPMGLRRRRHFANEGKRIVGIEDEVFAADGATEDGDVELVGTGALLAALEQSRSGRMRDIVATVQREQDEVIRAPLPGVLVVQGGPGTGKTAVALHRAAYLLYTYRFPLERQGVLVLGPNPVFLRYIELVLPSLGETGVVLSTVDGLVADARARATDVPLAAQVKGDTRMVRFLSRAVADRQRALPADLDVPFGPYRLRLSARTTADIVSTVKRRPGTHNARRRQVETLVLRRLESQYKAAAERATRAGLRPDTAVPDDLAAEYGLSPADVRAGESDDDLFEQLRVKPEVTAALDRMWPLLTPVELVHDLFGAPALIASAGRDLLSDAEQKALHRPRSAHADEIRWTSADLALLDEAAVLLGPRKRRRAGDDGQRTYGHIVVDEAQDLSPMQLRLVARRSMSGSMTIVGDVAQATGPWAPARWEDVLAHLPDRRPARVVELSINYRTPSEIMDVAARVLAVALPNARAPRPVRSSGVSPLFVPVVAARLHDEIVTRAVELLQSIGNGTVAVISPSSMLPDITAAFERAGVPYGQARESLDAAITLVAVEVVKGLEFDGALVVEPARLLREAHQGDRALFVALTRPTKRLTVVHAEPLPSVLA
ncbi:MAG TPA: UvrD-helicase domain-containing protein [Acidimicrobiales bacterium]|nr:UvrD-helicase domain-containing protein [Acidimicrobiales bacterium]